MPPPAAVESGAPPSREPLVSQLRPKRQPSTPAARAPARPAPPRGRTQTSRAPSANVDEVVADLRNDPRVDDDE
jgi:hypothetical protein